MLTPTGDRHFLGPRLGDGGGVTLTDASATGQIDDPQSVLAFASTGTLGGFSGGLGVDRDSLFHDGVDGYAQAGQ